MKETVGTPVPKGGILNRCIVPIATVSHKCASLLLLAALLAVGAQSAASQEVARDPWVSVDQVLSFSGAVGVFGASLVLDHYQGPPPCAPCDPGSVPGFDRWIIRPPVRLYAAGSDLLLLGLASGTLVDAGFSQQGRRRVLAELEAVAWTMGVVGLSKSLIGRDRPVLYTEVAPDVADEVINQRSMPSGHAALAFTMATSYWLSNPERGLAPKLAAVAAAVGIGVLRVASAKHFPSDVVVGAVVGTGVAFAVHTIRF
ncbi:MAG: phosphatase PAP2 family protein [Gemmatimonadota bacterium]|nr:phosphatase PAP2 family protein [Gemmatimonadota bacterium]